LALYLMIAVITLLMVAFIPMQIHIFYQRINNEDKIKMQIKIFFITLDKSFSAPLAKVLSLLARKKYTRENIEESIKAKKLPERNWGLILRRLNIWLPRGIQIFSHALNFTSKIFKPIKCKKLNIYTEIGLFDASQTGLAYGSFWAGYSFLVSLLSKWMILKPETPTIKIVPNFNNSKLHLEYDCIIAFPLGHIIIVFIQTVRFLRVSSYLIKGIKREVY